MSKRIARAPKRRIQRAMHVLASYNGQQSDITLRAAGDPATLVRTIIQAKVISNIETPSIQTMDLEIWRADITAGFVLPTMDQAGDVPYAQNDDLVWKGRYVVLRETTSDSDQMPVNVDMKGNRKLGRNEALIIRFEGASTISISGVITSFYKEV